MNRSGERGVVPARRSRFYQAEEYWYYRTREGIDIGPFDTQADAVQGVGEFIEYVLHQNPAFTEILAGYRHVAA